MYSALIVSGSKQGAELCREMLERAGCTETVCAATGGAARRLLVENSYELCLVNAPLPDEFGQELACRAAEENSCQVILFVKAELYDSVALKVENDGVITLAKPVNRALLWSALKMAQAAAARMRRMENQQEKLLQKIEDIKVIDRAKCALVGYLNMTEEQAHKYIEKHAMDLRKTKRQVADDVLKTYDSGQGMKEGCI